MALCIIAECLKRDVDNHSFSTGVSAGFTVGSRYYFEYTTNSDLGTVKSYNNSFDIKVTTHRRENIEDKQILTIRGCLFKVVAMKEVPSDFNFMLGEYSIESVMSELDRQEFKRLKSLFKDKRIIDKEVKRIKQLHSKYTNKLKLEV